MRTVGSAANVPHALSSADGLSSGFLNGSVESTYRTARVAAH